MKKIPISNENRVLLNIFLLLLVFWLVFDALKFTWADDPFQKVVLAPLGEEPNKLIYAFLIGVSVIIGQYIPSKSSKKKNPRLKFSRVFTITFIPSAMLIGIVFGHSEGPFQNILLHFSTSSLGALLFVLTYQIVKDKKWSSLKKSFTVFITIIIPMVLHSISNQYANISTANNFPKFDYLVVIGRFLENSTPLSSQGIFTSALFTITVVILYIAFFKYVMIDYVYIRLKEMKKKDE